jgi:predicted small secreted protein
MTLVNRLRSLNVGAIAALALIFGALCVNLTGCNTTSGAGKDIESAGRGIHNAAEHAKD